MARFDDDAGVEVPPGTKADPRRKDHCVSNRDSHEPNGPCVDSQTRDSLDRLVQPVLEFATRHFALRDDLANLLNVQKVTASEAVILYCARILEVLAAEALRIVELEPSANVFSNLDTLQQFNLIQTSTRYWAHALRRTGNWARHIQRKVTPDDADWAVLFTERWLDWFFRQFRFGERLANLTQDRDLSVLKARDELRALMEAFDAPDFDPCSFLELTFADAATEFFQNPTLPAVLAEMLLDRKALDLARKTIDAALHAFPDDLRLRQLKGLYFSRTNQLAAALAWLEPLYRQFRDDEETAGILASVYRKHWIANRSDVQSLAKAQRTYFRGWERSGKTSTYLGINAATTALLLGHSEESRQIAAAVEKILHTRAAALARHAANRDLTLNYWDHVTRAEVQLLLGRDAQARATYRDAFARPDAQQGNVEVTKAQIGEILKARGAAESPEIFLVGNEASVEA